MSASTTPEGRDPDREQTSAPRWSRPGELLALLGLTGFAISQPLLSVAGENTELFTFNNVDGPALVVYALGVALVPPLLLWGLVVAVGLVSRKAADVLFITCAAALAALTVVQVLKSARVSNGLLLGIVASLAAIGFGAALLRIPRRPRGSASRRSYP